MTLSRRTIVGSIPFLLAGTKAGAQTAGVPEKNWPVRPVRFIVPAAAGSAGDDVCRLVAQKLGEKFGQQFVIVNQSAAVGSLAIADLARAAPDGYTVGQISTTTNVIAKLYNPALSYDPVKNFAPISLLGSSPYVLAAFPGLPAKSVAELVALARARRQPLSNAVFGTMSLGFWRRNCSSRKPASGSTRFRIAPRRRRCSTSSPGASMFSSRRCRPPCRSFAPASCARLPPPARSASPRSPTCRRWR